MLIFKKLKKFILFVIIIFFINFILEFSLVPYNSSSSKVWKDYFSKEKIELVFVGSSIGQAFNDNVIEDKLGVSSLRMSSAGQGCTQSHFVIKEIIKKHKVKKVILAFGYFTLEQENNIKNEMAFFKNKNIHLPVKERISENMKFVFSDEHIKNPESINYFFDWIYNNVSFSLSGILNNLKHKMEKICNIKNKNKHKIEIVNYNKVGNAVSIKVYFNKKIPEVEKQLKEIIKLCEENNIEFIVVNTPHPVYDILGYGEEYFIVGEEIKGFFKKLKVSYYDFNLIKPSIFKSEEDYFIDFEHMNEKGALEFSKSFAEFMKLREKGENMDKYFYTPEEYLASIKHISIVNFDTENNKEGINIVAKAYTGSKVNVEYEILVYDDILKEYKVIREYAKNPTYFYPVSEKRKYKIRVNARQIGTNIPYERYYEKEIVFKK